MSIQKKKALKVVVKCKCIGGRGWVESRDLQEHGALYSRALYRQRAVHTWSHEIPVQDLFTCALGRPQDPHLLRFLLFSGLRRLALALLYIKCTIVTELVL